MQNPLNSTTSFLIARVGGHYVLAIIALLVPAFGPNRFLLAALLALVVAPVSAWLGYRFNYHRNGWGDAFVDLLGLLLLVHLVPQMWHVVLMVGIVMSLSPEFNLQPRSHYYYAAAAAILLSGMSFAGWLHQVDGWTVPIIVLLGIYPVTIYYARWQARLADKVREDSQRLAGLTKVAGGIAHDFNNILTSVIGNTELALEELPSDSSAARHMHTVLGAASRASLLSRQILTFADQQNVHYAAFDLKQSVDTAVIYLKASLPEGQVLSVQSEPSLPAVYGDTRQIQQVLLNLIINAIEASDHQTEIRIRVFSTTQPPQVIVEVEDFGSGISAEAMPRIFDPFFTSKSRGHGFGLAAVKRIIQEHQGTIDITSEAHKGTLARVSLRIAGTEAGAKIKPAPADTDSKLAHCDETILIIDDEESIRYLMRRVVESAGFKALTAANGQAGLALYKQHHLTISAILLDLKMPVMNGWQCLEGIRQLNEEIPVLIVSGYDPDQGMRHSHQANLKFLSKPFRINELSQAVAALIKKE